MPQVMTKGPYDDSQPMADVNGSSETAETGSEPHADDSTREPGSGRQERDGVSAQGSTTTRVRNQTEDAEDEDSGNLSEPEKSPVQGSLASSSDSPPEGSRVPLDPEQRPGGSAERTKTERESPSSVDHSPDNRAPDSLSSSSLMDVDSGGSPAPARAPAPAPALGQSYTCCWDLCQLQFPSSPDLAEHIRDRHVDSQTGGMFVCLWKGCKVYNTPSTSQSWLQRHMLSHSGDKPFKCVVGGCNATFASQGGLARHVPTHFSFESSKVSGHGKVKEESPSKAGLNKRRKQRNKQRRSLPRPHDFFDAQTMDAIRHRAICLNLATHIESLGSGHSVVFDSTVIARRREDSGKVKVLLHWTPEDILPDVWVNESERLQQKTKVVHLSKLPTDTAVLLDPNIYRMFF